MNTPVSSQTKEFAEELIRSRMTEKPSKAASPVFVDRMTSATEEPEEDKDRSNV